MSDGDDKKKGKKGGSGDKSTFHVRTRKYMNNKLLQRKQMVIDVSHFGRASVPKAELREKVAKMFKAKDSNQVVLFGFKMAFGGGKTTGFCLVYDDMTALKKFEPRYRLIRQGLGQKKEGSAKQKKEKKNRLKKLRGVEKAKKAA